MKNLFQVSISMLVLLGAFVVEGADSAEVSAAEAAVTEEDSELQDDGAEIEEISLEDLLAKEIAAGESGSFGYRLASYGIDPYLHAYAVMDFNDTEGKTNTFDMHYFNVFVGANINDVVVPEVQLEYEHGGEEIQMRFGQIDLRLAGDAFTLRAGKFLVPMGVYNEFLYPEFISKTPQRPFALREIVPVSWAEVGLQARGKYELGLGRGVNYAVYVVNGLEQSDGGDGGAIRGMRNNHRDKYSSDKAFGGKIEVEPLSGLRLGFSTYMGAYTRDGAQDLSISDVNVGWTSGPWTLQSEYVWATQDVAAGADLDKSGGYVLGSYRTGKFEPVVQFDWIELDGAPEKDRERWTAGFNYFPFDDLAPSLVIKTSYEWVDNDGVDIDDNALWVQLAIGF